QGARELRYRQRDVLVLLRERRQDRVRGDDQAVDVGVARREGVRQVGVVVDQARQLMTASGNRGRDAGQVALGRPECLEDRVQILAVAGEALAEPVDQQLQVRAGIGVEGRQELVRVDVRLGVLNRDRRVLLE